MRSKLPTTTRPSGFKAALMQLITPKSISGLTDDANRIGEVVNPIREITKRTNLLALNAKIQATRAVKSGRGFAIVTAKVNQLVGQTAETAQQITEQVKRIRDGVTETYDHI